MVVIFLDGRVKNRVFFCRYFDYIWMYLDIDCSFHGLELEGDMLRT